MKSILIIDDNRTSRATMRLLFTVRGFSCYEAKNEDQALQIFNTNAIDVILCNTVLGHHHGLDTLSKMKSINPEIPVVMMSDHNNIRIAVDAIRRGASNYVMKSLSPDLMVSAILKALSLGDQVQRLPDVTPKQVIKDEYILSTSVFFKQILETVDLVAPTNYSVILYGESGTGKEAFAREIHRRSTRASSVFHAIDCGTLSSELARSVLFGHEQGSFTGAIKQQKGAFEMASGGTLFLDEITNLGLDIQASLLRVIQEKKVKRIGGNEEIAVDVRIVVASNVRLVDAVKMKIFREDLYYRFNEFELNILPLRDRKDDIVFYAQHFLTKTNAELQKKIKSFSSSATEAMLAYQWPGNLRELRNVIRRAVLNTDNEEITELALPLAPLPPAAPVELSTERNLRLSQQAKQKFESDYQSIINVLQRNGFNKSKAASVLNIDLKILGARLNAFAKIKGFKLEF